MRKAQITRHTTETQIDLALTIEGSGKYQVSTGIRFFDHMLELFTRHGGFDLKLTCKGDLDVDQHHTVEDVGIALGEAFDRALGDKKGINRAGYFLMPMDETLGIAAIDLSGRTAVVVDAKFARVSSAICNPNLSTTSSTDSLAAPGRTSISKRCTAAQITTRSKLCSKPSQGRCAWLAPATSNSQRCFPVPRAFYDHPGRLSRGQSRLRAQGLRVISVAKSRSPKIQRSCAHRVT